MESLSRPFLMVCCRPPGNSNPFPGNLSSHCAYRWCTSGISREEGRRAVCAGMTGEREPASSSQNCSPSAARATQRPSRFPCVHSCGPSSPIWQRIQSRPASRRTLRLLKKKRWIWSYPWFAEGHCLGSWHLPAGLRAYGLTKVQRVVRRNIDGWHACRKYNRCSNGTWT